MVLRRWETPIAVMNAPRLSIVFLSVALLAGAIGLRLPSALGIPVPWAPSETWAAVLRALCVGALAAFLVSFLATLDRSPLVRR